MFSFCFWWLESRQYSSRHVFTSFMYSLMLEMCIKRNCVLREVTKALLLLSIQVSYSSQVYFSSVPHSPSSCAFSFPAPLADRYGLIHQARISASVNAMRVLNTGTEVEAAVADALVSFPLSRDCIVVMLRISPVLRHRSYNSLYSDRVILATRQYILSQVLCGYT